MASSLRSGLAIRDFPTRIHRAFMLCRIGGLGSTSLACLVDFGVDDPVVLDGVGALDVVRPSDDKGPMKNQTQPVLEGERVVVRMAREEDVREIVTFYERNEEFFSTMTTRRPPEFFTEAFWRTKVEQAACDYAEDRALGLFAFERERKARVIAAVNFFAFIRGNFHACILGYSLDEAMQGEGSCMRRSSSPSVSSSVSSICIA